MGLSHHAGRIFGGAASIMLFTAASIGLSAQPAGASSSGCTAAPGNLGALTCIYVNGSGLWVNWAQSTYSSPGNNVCNMTAQFKYRPYGASTYTVSTYSRSGCVFYRMTLTHYFYRNMTNQSSFCARNKNSATGYTYGPWVCETIKG